MLASCLAQATKKLCLHVDEEVISTIDGVHESVLDALKVICGFLMNSKVIKQVKDDRDTRPLLSQHVALMCLAFWEVTGCYDANYRERAFIRDNGDLVVELVFSALMGLAHFNFNEQLFSVTHECDKVAIVIRTPKRPRVNRRPLITKKTRSHGSTHDYG